MEKNELIGTFECTLDDLINCDGFYTSPLNPVSIPIFGSIQVPLSKVNKLQLYSELCVEDNSTSGLSLSISRIVSNPPHPYLLISRLTEKGIRIPIYRSHVLNKMNRSRSTDSGEGSTVPVNSTGYKLTSHTHLDSNALDGGYNFGKISILNQDLLNGSMKCSLIFEVFNHNPNYRDYYCGHAVISASHFATIQNGSHFSIDYLIETALKWRTESCRIIEGNSDLIRSFKDMVKTKINSISSSSYVPENVETISTEKKANTLLSNFYYDKRNPYHCHSGYIYCLFSVMNRTHIGSLIIDEIETVYKNSFFDYRDVTNIDFMIAVDMSSSVKHASHSNLRNP